MIQAGARGNTKSQIQEALGGSDDRQVQIALSLLQVMTIINCR
jgi:hypothetical protein